MSGCTACGCFRRGVTAHAEQEAAWATYRENVDYSDGWRYQSAFWRDHARDMQNPEYAEAFTEASSNADWVFDATNPLSTLIQRWTDVH